jgi:hypothetical protein
MEDIMTFLSTVNLISYQAAVDRSPAFQRRQKLVSKIEQQLALLSDAAFRPTRQIWQKAADGSLALVQKEVRLKPWWSKAANGKVVVTVRYGSKPLQLSDGCNAIELAEESQLPEVLTKLKEAVLLGEFDAVIESSVADRKLVVKKKDK